MSQSCQVYFYQCPEDVWLLWSINTKKKWPCELIQCLFCRNTDILRSAGGGLAYYRVGNQFCILTFWRQFIIYLISKSINKCFNFPAMSVQRQRTLGRPGPTSSGKICLCVCLFKIPPTAPTKSDADRWTQSSLSKSCNTNHRYLITCTLYTVVLFTFYTLLLIHQVLRKAAK